jgi:hypothetical protein
MHATRTSPCLLSGHKNEEVPMFVNPDVGGFDLSRLVPTNQDQTAWFSFRSNIQRVIFLDGNFLLKSTIIYSNTRMNGAGIAQSV